MAIKERAWYAWIDEMPPEPRRFHIVGEVQVQNLGVEALLTVRGPQGIDPYILRLNLNLHQKSGVWPQMVAWVAAVYDETMLPLAGRYIEVQVFHGDELLVTEPVYEPH